MDFIKHFIALFLIAIIFTAKANDDALSIELQSLKEQKAQVEYCLDINVKKEGQIDTIYLKKKLHKLLTHQNIGVRLSYYLLLADATSMLFDRVNPITDNYFETALKIAKESEQEEYILITLIRRGYYYFTYREISRALPYFLSASKSVNHIELDKVPLTAHHLQYLADFFGYIDESKKAMEYYKLAINYAPHLSRQAINLTNAIGVYYFRDKLYENAEQYYKNALKIASEAKDSVWVGIINGNLSQILLAKGDTTKAIMLAEINVTNSIRYNEYLDAMRTLLGLAEIAVVQGKWENAKSYINQATKYFEPKPYFIQYKTDAYRLTAKIAEAEGNLKETIINLNKFITYNDSLQQQKGAEKLQKIAWKWESERYELALNASDNKRKQDRLRDITISLIVILTLLSATLLIHRSRQKIKLKSIKLEKEQLVLLLEKKRLDEELSQSKKDMREFLEKINENENVIFNLEKKLSDAQQHQQRDSVIEIQNSLNQMLESHIMTDERWYKFKVLFETSYPHFFEEQRARYPNISENNLRLLSLSELNLSNQSIAHLLGISLDGVKKAKQRLRKKIVFSD